MSLVTCINCGGEMYYFHKQVEKKDVYDREYDGDYDKEVLACYYACPDCKTVCEFDIPTEEK
jgi:hypothetical protein